MSTKKTTDRPTVDLDRVLASRTPDFTLGGITFEGRPIGWTAALEFDSKRPAEQLEVLLRALRARTEAPDAITEEWVEANLTRPAIDLVVGILFRGERPTER
jgi:hypothetical protein